MTVSTRNQPIAKDIQSTKFGPGSDETTKDIFRRKLAGCKKVAIPKKTEKEVPQIALVILGG